MDQALHKGEEVENKPEMEEQAPDPDLGGKESERRIWRSFEIARLGGVWAE